MSYFSALPYRRSNLWKLGGSLLVGLVAACSPDTAVPSEPTVQQDSLERLAKRPRKGDSLPQSPAPSETIVPDRAWTGINANTGFWPDLPYTDQTNKHMHTLGADLARTGMNHVGGFRYGEPFNWGARDVAVNAHLAAGVQQHMVISPIDLIDRGTTQAEWERNWAYFAGAVMRRYKGKLFYYIIDNEPDCCGSPPSKNVTPAQMVALTKIAFDSARAIDPDIKIESPPTTSPASSFLRDMINLGVTRYADYLGVHGYGSQINDEHGQSLHHPWAWMLASGYPVRPIANSENGTDAGYGGWEWVARWYRMNYLQHKRYGYDHTLLFGFRGIGYDGWDIASWDGTQLVPKQAPYDAIIETYRKRPFANGGFEEANNREVEWVIYWQTHQTGTPIEWARVEFVRAVDEQARSGTGYLRFDTGESRSQNRVRRVVEHLTPGRQYTLSAWVNISGGGTATLRALGFNHLNGLQQAAQVTSTRDSWQQLSVSFTPSKTWVVVELAGTGTGSAGHVMRWDDVTMQ